MLRRFFITGTDTDVGKTVASTALVNAFVTQGQRVIGHKPISAGCEQSPEGLVNDDALQLIAQSNVTMPYHLVNPIALREPIAPHIAAAQCHQTITSAELIANYAQLDHIDADVLISEGAGGWCLPINDSELLPEVVSQLDIQVILVVAMRLGCLNHALLTQQAIEQSGCQIAGWIANAPHPQLCMDENLATLTARIDAPLLGIIPNVSNAKAAAQYLDISLLD